MSLQPFSGPVEQVHFLRGRGVVKSIFGAKEISRVSIFNSGRVLLVLVCKIHFWVSCYITHIQGIHKALTPFWSELIS